MPAAASPQNPAGSASERAWTADQLCFAGRATAVVLGAAVERAAAFFAVFPFGLAVLASAGFFLAASFPGRFADLLFFLGLDCFFGEGFFIDVVLRDFGFARFAIAASIRSLSRPILRAIAGIAKRRRRYVAAQDL